MTQEHRMFIGGEWCAGGSGATLEVVNPASDGVEAVVCLADEADLDRALETSAQGFKKWRAISPWDRSRIIMACARNIRENIPELARVMTLEQGKPLLESKMEMERAVEFFEWCAAEAVRTYGRLLPQRAPGLRQTTIKEPIGPVAAFVPWNFPGVLTARKVASALGAGCSIVIKPSEEAPGVAAGIVKACQDAGVPDGALNLVFGEPAKVSEHLIRSPIIKKVSLTGSVAVGRKLSRMAGELLKPATMELGGHAPVLVFEDADPIKAAEMSASFKYRNAGQVCIGVSRIFVHESSYKTFLGRFLECTKALNVGDGLDNGVTMGPMANMRGIDNMERVMDNANDHGAKTLTGGKRIGNKGCFWEPTVLNELPDNSMLMTEEPFGPIAPVVPFSTFDEALERANDVELGLAAYAFTRSLDIATNVADGLEAGWIGINNFSPALADAPFGGMKDSGFGYEGGPEGFDAYCQTKFVSQENMGGH